MSSPTDSRATAPTSTTRTPRGIRGLAVVAAALCALVALVLPAGTPADAAEPFRHYTDPGLDFPDSIVNGPDGNLWFFSFGANDAIGRITPTGTISLFADPGLDLPTDSVSDRIVNGPDGNLWFANGSGIGRITPTGTISIYDSPEPADLVTIVNGPDGNLWFPDSTNDSIGRITPTGTITTYTDPSTAKPSDLVTGPDGNLWFTQDSGIGRITPTGTITTYTDPSLSDPSGIVNGPDGNLWFTDFWPDLIGRITPTGTITTYTDPGTAMPSDLVTGPDGNLWFTRDLGVGPGIGRITPTGNVTTYTSWGISVPQSLTSGPDGNLWFTSYGTDSIARITPIGLITVFSDSIISGPSSMIVGPDDNLWFTDRNSIGRFGLWSSGWTSFSDVPAAHPFAKEIGWLGSSGITTGHPDGTFRPNSPVSRQAMASFLWRYEEQPASTLTQPFFADVPSDHSFYTAIQWMAETGVSTGSPNPAGGKPLFKPIDNVSRQATAAFLWRNSEEPAPTLSSAFFADVSNTSGFYNPIQWMAETGVSTGSANAPGNPLYKPSDPVSRQAMAAFLYRYNDL